MVRVRHNDAPLPSLPPHKTSPKHGPKPTDTKPNLLYCLLEGHTPQPHSTVGRRGLVCQAIVQNAKEYNDLMFAFLHLGSSGVGSWMPFAVCGRRKTVSVVPASALFV